MCATNEITQHDIGLFRCELRDVRAVVANIDHRTRKLIEPVSVHRPAGLVARYAPCKLIAIKEKRQPEALAKQHFAYDTDLAHMIELKAAVSPAALGVAGWAQELAATDGGRRCHNLLPASVLAQLRAASGLSYGFIDGAAARVCRCVRRRHQAVLSPRAARSRLARASNGP